MKNFFVFLAVAAIVFVVILPQQSLAMESAASWGEVKFGLLSVPVPMAKSIAIGEPVPNFFVVGTNWILFQPVEEYKIPIFRVYFLTENSVFSGKMEVIVVYDPSTFINVFVNGRNSDIVSRDMTTDGSVFVQWRERFILDGGTEFVAVKVDSHVFAFRIVEGGVQPVSRREAMAVGFDPERPGLVIAGNKVGGRRERERR